MVEVVTLLIMCRRFNIKVPRYSQMIAALTWMSHSQNLRRMAREHPIDLYMQPPVTRFRLLDYHLMDRIVRDSNRCAPPALPISLSGGSGRSTRCLCSV